MERITELIVQASELSREVQDASPSCIAILQVKCTETWRKLFNMMCSGAHPQSTVNALIMEGDKGRFVAACLIAQEIHWPDQKCRLRIVEDAVGILDNCTDVSYLLSQGCLDRVCLSLASLEDVISTHESNLLVSGAVESFGLVLDRMLKKSEDATPNSFLACKVLVRILKRKGLDEDAIRACANAVRTYGTKPLSGDLKLCADAKDLQALQEVMHKKFQDAYPYLEAQEAYSMLLGDESDVTDGIAAIRASREKCAKQKSAQS